MIEKVTGQSFESYIDNAIFQPLGMSKSTLFKPPDSAAVIPPWPHFYDIDLGVQKPTGGIYSSSADLSKYLRYILTHYNGITHAVNWANPASTAVGLYSFYGMPWEIFHTNKILPDPSRVVRFITKGGGVPAYFSYIIFLPEYDLGITILEAGQGGILDKLREIVTVQLVRAADDLAIQQLQERYSGTFVSTNPKLNSSLVLKANHRGLVISKFISNSTDTYSAFAEMFAPKDRPWYGQVVPTMLYRNETEQEGERWRFLFVEEPTSEDEEIWDDFCVENVDGVRYAGLPINELVFWGEAGKPIDSVELTGFRAKLLREKKGDAQYGYEQVVVEL